MTTIEQKIREYAFKLWERAGRPDGRSDEFWTAAKAEIEREAANEKRLAPPVRRSADVRCETAADWATRVRDPSF
jgi:hypothetical protein